MPPGQAALQRADNGHRPHAKQKGCAHKPFCNPFLFPAAGTLEFLFQKIPQTVDLLIEIQRLPNQSPDYHGENQHQSILPLQGTADPDVYGTQTQRLHNPFGKTF